MHQRWRWNALLRGLFSHGNQKFEVLDFDAMRMPKLSGDDESRRRALHVRVGVLKMPGRVRQQAFDNFHPLDLAQKIGMPERAAKLSIGDSLHADVFLHVHRVTNAAVFDLP